jgi:hypothetical protein
MYLAVTLLELGFNLRPRVELGKEGPDISIRSEETKIWIEAIACGTIPDDFAEYENDSEPIDEAVILRYTSAIADKFKKYEKYLQKGILSNSDPYIIAVNGSRVPFSTQIGDQSITMPDIIKAVMPFGDYTMIMDQDTNQVLKSGYHYRPEIFKPSGKPVQTTTFLDPNYDGISAIMFSNMNIRDIPNRYGNDFLFFHNPRAINPLPRGWFRAGYEYRSEGDELFRKNWKWV